MNIPFKTDSLVQKVSVKSAVNASLWACVVISTPLFIISTQINGWLQVAFFVVATIPVIAFVVSYFYFLFKNPDYLRSEEYQLKAESLKLLGDKDNPLHAAATDVVSVAIPGLSPPNQQNENE